MPGQAVVAIRDKQWSVTVANTYAELTTGLSGVESIPSQTGMLFDLGYDSKTIQVDMSRMLFPLDIIFINSTQGVVGVMQNVEPGQSAELDNEALPGARCFLEVNAGEAEGIEDGDSVNIQGYAQPAQFDIGSLINIGLILVMSVVMFKVVGRTLELPKERPAIPTRITEEEQLQEKKQTLENRGREIARAAGVEFLRVDKGWEAKYAVPRYWFRDTKGNEIIATDIKELKEKLELLGKRSTAPEHHSMWLTLEQRKELEKKYGAVAVRWAEEATRPGDIKAVGAAAEYYHRKLEEVLGLGHLSPKLSEEQIMKLREVLGLPPDVSQVLKIHRKTGYVP
jgi:uncharacterized membrane protein (UPF0127 family)